VIDPIVYSTYLGGSSLDEGNAVGTDAGGNVYITGYTFSSDFPTQDAVKDSNALGIDAFVTKLTSSGAVGYSTYLGGSSHEWANAIAVDASSYQYVTGATNSTDFPTLDAAQAELSGPATDAFVTKLTSDGTLSYSTYLGGRNGPVRLSDDYGYGIAVDTSGNAYVAGLTESTEFPTLNAVQGSFGGYTDGFVTKLTSSGALSYSTYLGTPSDDHANAIAVDAAGNAYVTGEAGPGFPTLDASQDSSGGGFDAYVTKLTPGGAISYSTFLGGSGHDVGNGIAVDAGGNAYVTGHTLSEDFPTLNAFQVGRRQNATAFVTKLTSSGALSYSTHLGGGGYTWGSGIAADAAGNAYVTGWTISTDFQTLNAAQGVHAGSVDAFMTRLTASGALAYSTYLGGSQFEHGNGIAVDGDGSAHVAGYTFSTDYPTLNAAQGAHAGGDRDAFVTKIDSSSTSITSIGLGGTSPYCVGSSMTINWVSTGVGSVDIDLSTDAGVSWISLASDQASGETGGSFDATVPNRPGSNCRVRVSDASNHTTWTITGRFGILPPVAVTSDPVSVAFCPGAYVTFSASATAADPEPRWQISIDGGVTFNDLQIDWNVYGLEEGSVLSIFTAQLPMDGYRYRAVFYNGCSSDTTAAATLHVGSVISGRLFEDSDGDCLRDVDEPGLAGRIVEVMPGPIYATTNELGDYSVVVVPGEYSINAAPLYFDATCPGSLPIPLTFSACGETYAGNDIAVRPDTGIYDLRVSLVGNRISATRPSDYYLEYWNVGTEPTAGTLRFTYDSTRLTFVGSSSAVDASSASTLEWSLATLDPGERGTIRVSMRLDPGIPVGTEICALADLELPDESIRDAAPRDNQDRVCAKVVASYDPNDKAVSPAGDACGRIRAEDSVLAYQVRFQNTGNDTAFTVVVRDALNASLLDIGTLEMGAASHPYTWSIEADNVLVIRFDDILLPDSNTSEPNSHGVVKYTLHLRPELAPGTAIPNSAAIYFDFNEPVITNQVVSTTPDFFIIEHPADQSVLVDESAGFGLIASGVSGVQWQLSTDDGATFTDLDGETWTSLFIAAATATMDGYQYRAVVTNTCETDTTDVATLDVQGDDAPPVPDVATLPDLTGECSVTIATPPTATASDGETVDATTDDPLSYSDQGTYTVHWTYDDGNGSTATQEQTVIVDDVTAPTLSVSLSPTTLWTPNNTMRTIAITASASDNCGTAAWSLSSITGNDGATSDDWSYTANTAPGSVDLRAERTGAGSGRTYTLSFTASDGHDNTTTATCYVSVPHDQNGKVVAGGSREAVAYGFLSDVVPNPFTASTDIRFTLPSDGVVSVRIYDRLGRDVAVLLRSELRAGAHSVVWNGLRSDGTRATAGQYFYRIECAGTSETGAVTLVR
jgi:hypothetical protein